MPVKVNGQTSGSVTVAAPATGSDVTLTLPGSTMDLGTELASKLPIAGGKILQIVRATDSTDRSTTSTSFVDAGISVTITPQRNDSAILLIWLFNGFTPSAGDLINAITDNSNNVISGAAKMHLATSTATQVLAPVILIGYATPATTSATTYKGRFRVNLGTGQIFNSSTNIGQLYAIEVSA